MGHQHKRTHSSTDNIRLAFFLNLAFTIVEFLGGIYTNSLAIAADAMHDLGDSFSLGLAWYFERVARKKRTPTFSFGYRRFSLLAALINALILFVGVLIILVYTIPKLTHPEPPHVRGMLAFAIFGIIVNGWAAYKVSHGKTLNERIVSWHLIEDVLGWVAVLVISIVMMFKRIYILDPILSILISVFVLWNVFKNLKKTMFVFLQASPDSLDVHALEHTILKNPQVRAVHDTHTWSLDGEYHLFSAHIVHLSTLTLSEIQEVKINIKEELAQRGIAHVTLEMESESVICKDHCGV